ncbi:MAG: hypothetical protein BroJett013_26210 [Alphaproteobacteria bacterium]|nr:MAG: hypothetical protein BroJett013_26210 [Alphaproteobacteria bacterium]
MDYYFSRTLTTKFEDAVSRATEALKQEGFGVISDIDVAATLRAKLGVDFRNYRILGACNPALAYEALQLEDKIGLMLPCNVIVQERSEGYVEVAVIDPVASMLAIDNAGLKQAAATVRAKLEAAIARL